MPRSSPSAAPLKTRSLRPLRSASPPFRAAAMASATPSHPSSICLAASLTAPSSSSPPAFPYRGSSTSPPPSTSRRKSPSILVRSAALSSSTGRFNSISVISRITSSATNLSKAKSKSASASFSTSKRVAPWPGTEAEYCSCKTLEAVSHARSPTE